jgi:hypothetical protein
MLYVSAIVVIFTTTLVCVIFAAGSSNSRNTDFLSSYGWEVQKKEVERADIIIPNPFDLVYERYNELQLKAGLDLRPYMGMNAVRYTYIVENYPRDTGSEKVRANVICVNGEPVGGDIMTVSLHGFMHSLLFSDADEQT